MATRKQPSGNLARLQAYDSEKHPGQPALATLDNMNGYKAFYTPEDVAKEQQYELLNISKDFYENNRLTDGEWLVDQLTPEQAEKVFLILQERFTMPISEEELAAAREEAKEEAMQAAETKAPDVP